MQKFTWRPDLGAKRNVQPLVTPTQFGDGYELRTASQLNVNKRTWDLTFTGPLKQCLDILAFLEKHEARLAFNYDDPLGQGGAYVCRQWSSSQTMFGVYQVEASFEEVFEN